MYVMHEYDNLIDDILTNGKLTTNRTRNGCLILIWSSM